MEPVVPSMDSAELERLHLVAIIESSDDAIVSKSLEGIVRTWNPAAERIFGYTAAEMVGDSIFRLVPPELHDEEHEILARIRSGERVGHYETTRVRKDGQRITISLTISPIRAPDGTLVGASAIKQDITERRRLEDQLRQAQKMEALGQLAGGVAHDFNNILTIISGFAAFLEHAVPDGTPARADLSGIQQATDRATRLTQQLLSFSRHQAAQPEVLDLSALVSETSMLLRRLLGEHIRLELRPAASPAWVRADRGQLSQVLLNLAVNARDAMGEGGTLTLTTYDDAAAGRVILTVRDTGKGMDAATQARLFDPFFTTKPRGKGTGLGLATVFGIVQKSGGRIDVDTAPGCGAVFRIALPRVDAPAGGAGAVDECDLRGRETVLVVDDERELADLAARTLLEYGYTVIRATGAGAAMVAFAERDNAVDLVLTDVVMPGMNGPALVERLRARRPGLAVLYMSGYSDVVLDDTRAARSDHALIPKPFLPRQLAEAVRRVLDGAAADATQRNVPGLTL